MLVERRVEIFGCPHQLRNAVVRDQSGVVHSCSEVRLADGHPPCLGCLFEDLNHADPAEKLECLQNVQLAIQFQHRALDRSPRGLVPLRVKSSRSHSSDTDRRKRYVDRPWNN